MCSLETQIDFLMKKLERVRMLKKRGYMSEADCDREIAMYDGIIDRLMALSALQKASAASHAVMSIFLSENGVIR